MAAKGLLFYGGGGARSARTHAQQGGLVVAWPGAETRALRESGTAFREAFELLEPGAPAAIEAAARAWARVWPRLPLSEGRSLRDLVLWREQSLLWTFEEFLRTETAGPRCVRGAELGLRLIESLQPSEIDVAGLPASDALLLSRAATACGVLFHGRVGPAQPLVVTRAVARPGALGRLLAGFARRRPPRPALALPGVATVLFLLDDPARQPRLDPLLGVLAARGDCRPWLVSTRDLVRFETRRSRRAVAEVQQRLRACHATLRGTPALAASYVHRGVGFADLAAGDLEKVLLERLPRAVGDLEAASALIAAHDPLLVVLAAAGRDERRTLGLAAAVAGVPWVTLRLDDSQAEEVERTDGGPQPAFTLALGEADDPGAAAARLAETVRDRVGTP